MLNVKLQYTNAQQLYIQNLQKKNKSNEIQLDTFLKKSQTQLQMRDTLVLTISW